MKKKKLEIVVLEFYHPDARINFFSASHLIEPLVSSKQLRFFKYRSSGNDHNNVYHQEHKLEVYSDQVEIVEKVLESEGWNCWLPVLK